MTAVLSRIFLRYLAGGLLAAGYLDTDLANTLASDPDLLMLIGAGIGLGVEGAYALAKKFDWNV